MDIESVRLSSYGGLSHFIGLGCSRIRRAFLGAPMVRIIVH